MSELPAASDLELVRSLIGVIAHAKGLSVLAKLALFDEGELEELLGDY